MNQNVFTGLILDKTEDCVLLISFLFDPDKTKVGEGAQDGLILSTIRSLSDSVCGLKIIGQMHILWESSHQSVQFSCSVVSDSLGPPWTAACQASLSITNSRSLLRFMSIDLVMPSNHLFPPLHDWGHGSDALLIR